MSTATHFSPRHRLLVSLVIFTQCLWSLPGRAADFYWDSDGDPAGNATSGAGLGGGGAWSTLDLRWWNGATLSAWANSAADTAIFTAPLESPANPSLITLDPALTANSLRFLRSGFTLDGGSLNLAGTNPSVFVSLGDTATINSLLDGTLGLLKSGGGALRLGNPSNTYTGATTVANGLLIISDPAALGASTTAVSVTGSGTRGLGGGALVLEGALEDGMNFTRNLDLQGRGPITDRSASLVSYGNNTLSGIVSTGLPLGGTAQNTALASTNGRLTLSGTLNAGGTTNTTFTTFGVINTVGAAGYDITGVLTGTGSVEKQGAGTMIFSPSDASAWSGTLRVSAGTIRLTTPTVLGTNAGTGTSSSLILNGDGAAFEIRADSFATTKNVYHGGISPTLFADHAIGSAAVNGLASFGNLAYEEGETLTFNGRNGYGMTFGTTPVQGGNGNTNFANNLGGLLTFTGAFWSNTENTASRSMTISGNGNTLISGNLTASAGSFDHTLVKSGSGILTITSVASTLDGAVSVQGGALAITDFRSITNNTGTINLANATTTAGALIIGTATAPTAAGLTTSKVINLIGTTGGGIIYANQTGTNPVILNGAITATGTGAKTLTLGGTSTVNNIVNSGIPDSAGATVTSFAKNGPGTWVLAGANTYSGATTITDGTLRLQDTFSGSSRDVLNNISGITFNVQATTQEAGSTLEYLGAAGAASAETVGALTPTAGANTVRVTAGGGGGTAALTFGSLGTLNASASVNFVSSGANTIAITGQSGYINNSRFFFNGADFAFFGAGGVVRAPVYGAGGDTNFSAANTFTASTHTLITANSSTPGAAITLRSLKLSGNVTLTLGNTLTLNNGGTNNAGNILATGGASLITGASSIVGPGTTALGVRVNLPSDSLTIESNLTGSTGGLTKIGEGKLILKGTGNTITGEYRINEGELELGAGARLGGDGATTFNALTIRNPKPSTPSTLDIGGNSISVGNLNGSGVITNDGAAATITVGQSNGTGTWHGAFRNGSGTLGVTKVGTGAQTWSGLSTFTGVTTIGSTGLVTVNTLANIGQPSGIGAGNATDDATNAASLVFNGSTGGLVYAGNLLNGALAAGSTSTTTNRLFTLSGTGATLSSTVTNNNAIVWSNTGAIVHGVIGPQTLVFTGTSVGDNRFNPQLTDSGTDANITSVSKTGAGVWVLGNSTNTYTGATTVSNGTLILGSAGALPASSPVVLGTTTTSGILESFGDFTRDLAATAVAGANTVTWGGTTGGGGFSASTGKLVVALGGLATPSSLQWGSGGFVPTGAPFVLNSTTGLNEVEFRNAIDLNGAVRTIQVNDNTSTGTDYATISGVLSDSASGGGISKTGAGTLRLLGDNTYGGTTTIIQGVLTVRSLGHSGVGGSTSIGSAASANLSTSALVLGRTGNSAGILQYVGPGETSDRFIQLGVDGGTGSSQIQADGTGALVLTNVNNTAFTNAKTLFLRGSNTAGNMITSQLSDNTGALSVTVDGGATWILTNGANNYSGTTSVNAGALGVGHDSALGTGALSFNNGSFFAYGGDRTINNPIDQDTNTTIAFIGDYGINFTSTYVATAGANNFGITSSLASGKTLQLADLTANAITATRTLTVNGTGETVINGNITTSTAFNLNLTYSGTGTLTLKGQASDWNAGTVTVSSGTLKIGNNEVIPHGSPTDSGNMVMSPALGATARLDLNGFSETINGLTANSAGDAIIDNTSPLPASLTLGANDAAVVFGGGAGNYTIRNSGGGALSINKIGTGAMSIPAGATLTYQGATTVSGGALTIASAVNGTNSLSVTGTGSLLALHGGITNPAAITSLTVGGGSTLSLLDGVGSAISNLTSLTLGSVGGAMSTLNLNIGDGQTDTLTLLTGGALNLFAGNQITFNLTDAGLSPGTTYTLLNIIDGGLLTGALTLADYLLGATPGGFTSIDIVRSNNTIQITTGNLITGDLYWNAGAALDNWNDVANWSTDKAGTSAAASIPGQGTDVVFIADNIVGGAAVTTTLEQNFKINSLTFEASTNSANTPASVTINPGAVLTNRIEISPQDSADGLKIATGGPAAVAINTPLRLGRDQTWDIAANTTLTLGGALFGAADVTKTGAGRVVLTTAADSTFNLAKTSDLNIGGGSVEMQNLAALGTVADDNMARVSINANGAFFYNNATAGTVPLPITLNGGTLSGGGNNHTYSSNISITADSTVNLRDSNSAVTTTTQRNITLSGVLSGAGKLTVDSIDTLTSGNPLTGTLTVNKDNSGWSGGVLMQRGTLATSHLSGLGTGALTFTGGKIEWQGLNGQTWTVANAIALNPGGVGELSVNNISGTVSSPFTADFTGGITLGAGASLRLASPDGVNSVLNVLGGIVLTGNASISAGGGTGAVNTISGVGISETGGPRTLTINDAGFTLRTLAINVASSHTGGTTLAGGTVLIGHKDAFGSGALTVTGASTITPTIDLSSAGVGPLPNTLVLNNNLTVTGNQPLTLSSTTTNSTGNRTFTNNIATGALLLGDVFLSEDAATGRTLTFAGSGLTTIGGVIANFNGAGAAGALSYTGTGTLVLPNANTYTGGTTISAGRISLGTKDSLGTGSLTVTGGTLRALSADLTGADKLVNPVALNGTLTMDGDFDLELGGPITQGASRTLTANGAPGAQFIVSGAITATGNSSLTLTGTGEGALSGGLTQTGTAADLIVNSGNWTISGTPNTVADDVIVSGANTVLNLNGTGIVSSLSPTSSGLYSRSGATINLGANEAYSTANGLDFIILGDNAVGGGTLNTNTFNITTPRLDLGAATPGFTGSVVGGGTVTVATAINLYEGTVSAGLSGAGAVLKAFGGTVTLSGNNGGLTGTTAARVDSGTLILDYTTSNTTKLRAATGLDMRGGTLTLLGNGSAPTTQTVASLTLGGGGANKIVAISGVGQPITLNLGAITRTALGNDGTLRIELPTSGAVTTTSANNTSTSMGILGGWATVNTPAGTFFARNDGANNIVASNITLQDDVASWTAGDNISDLGGFTGTVLDCLSINSLRFDANAASAVTIAAGARLGVATGGILMTANAATGNHTISGGTLVSGIGELIFIQDSTAQDLTVSSSISLATGVTKSGAGALRLTGSNDYSGPTEIQAGAVRISGGNAIGNSSVVTLADDQVSSLQLLSSETIGGLTGGNATSGFSLGTVDIGANALTIGGGGTYAGVFTGNGLIIRDASNNGSNLNLTGNTTGFSGSVIVNGGLFQISGANGRLNAATSFTINKGGAFLIDNDDDNSPNDRLSDTAAFTLNSADGTFSGQTVVRGLAIRTNNNATENETIGVLTFGSGANYLSGEASGTTGVASIIADNFVRANNSTVAARGRALGLTTGDRNQFRIGNATAQTAFIGTTDNTNLVGGDGAAGTKTIDIVPWAIGETTSGALADSNMGNSLVTYVSGQGFRPLDFVSEYGTFAALAGPTENIRESLTADLTGVAGATVNSLVLHNNNASASSAVNVTGTGAGQTLAIRSGALLFTLNPAATGAHTTTLGGFDDGITMGGAGITNEYVIHVVNPSSAAGGPTLTATISSPLTTAADITKSGRGTLILTGLNTAGGGANKTTINEGTLEIADLDNIGGNAGAVVFAGGTLRLGATLSDDVSTRAFTFLTAGGAIDTNGVDRTFANSFGTGTGGFAKTGAGVLTFGAAAGYTGGTAVLDGTLRAGIANVLPASGRLVINGANAAFDMATFNQTVGVFTLANGSLTGNATLTASEYQLQSGAIGGGAVLAGAAGITKTTNGTVTLSGNHTFTGPIAIRVGNLSLGVIGSPTGVAGPLGAHATAAAGAIQLGLGNNAAGVIYTGPGESTSRQIDLMGTTGAALAIHASGTGALTWTGEFESLEGGAKAVVLRGTSDPAIINTLNNTILECFGTVGITKQDANTWQMSAAYSYTGATSVDEGKLIFAVDQTLSGALNFGSTNAITTAGTLDLTSRSGSFGSLVAQTNSPTNTSQVLIGAGQSLNINGPVTLGSGLAASTTRIAASGAGTVNVANSASAATFGVGGSSSGRTFADFSGLAAMNVSLNTTDGLFRVSSTTGTNADNVYSEMILAVNSNITAKTLTVGGGGGFNGSSGQVNKLFLGTGANVLRFDTVNLGTGAHDLGAILFHGVTGSVNLRDVAGTGRVAFNMGTGTASTGVSQGGNANTFDVTGHDADLLLGAVSIGTQNARTSFMTNVFSFNQGTLDMTSLTMGSKTASGDSTNTMNLGGGTVVIGSGSGTAMTLATNSGASAVSATINVTGGTVTVAGNVVRGNNTGAGAATATFNLNGGALDFSGFAVGSSTNQVVFNAQSGSLGGLGQLNGGATGLTKSTAGVLIMGNGNTYTGGTTVSGGTLVAANTAGSATGVGAVSVASGAILAGAGSISGPVTLAGTISPGAVMGANSLAGQLTIGSLSIQAGGRLEIQLGGATALDPANVQLFQNDPGSFTVPTSWTDYTAGATAHDQLLLTAAGAPNLDGLTVDVLSSYLGGFEPTYGHVFQILDWASLGTDDAVGNVAFNLPTLSNYTFDTTFFKSHGLVMVIPEPTRVLLLVFGIAGLLLRRRRVA